MSGKIFVIDEGDSLHELVGTRYESEALLQSLLENHSDLLAGDQIND